jgi:hypothetical protein
LLGCLKKKNIYIFFLFSLTLFFPETRVPVHDRDHGWVPASRRIFSPPKIPTPCWRMCTVSRSYSQVAKPVTCYPHFCIILQPLGSQRENKTRRTIKKKGAWTHQDFNFTSLACACRPVITLNPPNLPSVLFSAHRTRGMQICPEEFPPTLSISKVGALLRHSYRNTELILKKELAGDNFPRFSSRFPSSWYIFPWVRGSGE